MVMVFKITELKISVPHPPSEGKENSLFLKKNSFIVFWSQNLTKQGFLDITKKIKRHVHKNHGGNKIGQG